MPTHTINRREFVALTTAAAATTAISTPTLANAGTKALKVPSPSLARLIPSQPTQSESSPTKARLQPNTHTRLTTTTLTNPLLTLTPLPCVNGRLDTDASITIELHHPTPDLYSILYHAHNITIPNKSIPAYAPSIQTKAPCSTPTLKVTQHTNNASKSTLLTLAPGAHILAIPTATNSSNTSFRFTSAHLDQAGQITKLTNPMPATSSRCAYFTITVDESTGV